MKRLYLYILIIAAVFALLYLFYYKDKNSGEYADWGKSINKLENNDQIKVLIDINEKKLYAVLNSKVVAKYAIACGKPDTPSPLGDFVIVQKDRWGEGFGTAWLGLDVPWGTP